MRRLISSCSPPAPRTAARALSTAYLKMYFPQVLDWFTEITSPIAGDFLDRWPTLQKVQRARPETLRKFFLQRHSCKLDNIDRRLEESRRALPATHDENSRQEKSRDLAPRLFLECVLA